MVHIEACKDVDGLPLRRDRLVRRIAIPNLDWVPRSYVSGGGCEWGRRTAVSPGRGGTDESEDGEKYEGFGKHNERMGVMGAMKVTGRKKAPGQRQKSGDKDRTKGGVLAQQA